MAESRSPTEVSASVSASAEVVGGGEASDEEVAAIVAAVEVAWPRPAAASSRTEPAQRWRFSGRWWTKPVPLRRGRPW